MMVPPESLSQPLITSILTGADVLNVNLVPVIGPTQLYGNGNFWSGNSESDIETIVFSYPIVSTTSIVKLISDTSGFADVYKPILLSLTNLS